MSATNNFTATSPSDSDIYELKFQFFGAGRSLPTGNGNGDSSSEDESMGHARKRVRHALPESSDSSSEGSLYEPSSGESDSDSGSSLEEDTDFVPSGTESNHDSRSRDGEASGNVHQGTSLEDLERIGFEAFVDRCFASKSLKSRLNLVLNRTTATGSKLLVDLESETRDVRVDTGYVHKTIDAISVGKSETIHEVTGLRHLLVFNPDYSDKLNGRDYGVYHYCQREWDQALHVDSDSESNSSLSSLDSTDYAPLLVTKIPHVLFSESDNYGHFKTYLFFPGLHHLKVVNQLPASSYLEASSYREFMDNYFLPAAKEVLHPAVFNKLPGNAYLGNIRSRVDTQAQWIPISSLNDIIPKTRELATGVRDFKDFFFVSVCYGCKQELTSFDLNTLPSTGFVDVGFDFCTSSKTHGHVLFYNNTASGPLRDTLLKPILGPNTHGNLHFYPQALSSTFGNFSSAVYSTTNIRASKILGYSDLKNHFILHRNVIFGRNGKVLSPVAASKGGKALCNYTVNNRVVLKGIGAHNHTLRLEVRIPTSSATPEQLYTLFANVCEAVGKRQNTIIIPNNHYIRYLLTCNDTIEDMIHELGRRLTKRNLSGILILTYFLLSLTSAPPNTLPSDTRNQEHHSCKLIPTVLDQYRCKHNRLFFIPNLFTYTNNTVECNYTFNDTVLQKFFPDYKLISNIPFTPAASRPSSSSSSSQPSSSKPSSSSLPTIRIVSALDLLTARTPKYRSENLSIREHYIVHTSNDTSDFYVKEMIRLIRNFGMGFCSAQEAVVMIFDEYWKNIPTNIYNTRPSTKFFLRHPEDTQHQYESRYLNIPLNILDARPNNKTIPMDRRLKYLIPFITPDTPKDTIVKLIHQQPHAVLGCRAVLLSLYLRYPHSTVKRYYDFIYTIINDSFKYTPIIPKDRLYYNYLTFYKTLSYPRGEPGFANFPFGPNCTPFFSTYAINCNIFQTLKKFLTFVSYSCAYSKLDEWSDVVNWRFNINIISSMPTKCKDTSILDNFALRYLVIKCLYFTSTVDKSISGGKNWVDNDFMANFAVPTTESCQ
ncbi:hypothetical protein BDF20DRAFT_833471 [Mycotypha africana]|uniref:uncharacterized protein n=1 Tax=Mycotypha africana TaxID=64632 RepID=UPI002301E607|nr:uncharacterized protein BDF20DRAFT_833471 [Mycotypha africana]KAI8988640.1 hypothetical protein BDF20DRAFT_833471 [Mycotypha africana]